LRRDAILDLESGEPFIEAIAPDMDEDGHGRSVVLLPAFSSISTREEMYPLFEGLCASSAFVTGAPCRAWKRRPSTFRSRAASDFIAFWLSLRLHAN
jgi:hypothetical protein